MKRKYSKRRNSKKQSKKRYSRKKYSKKRYSKKRYSKGRYSKKRSTKKRSLRGGSREARGFAMSRQSMTPPQKSHFRKPHKLAASAAKRKANKELSDMVNRDPQPEPEPEPCEGLEEADEIREDLLLQAIYKAGAEEDVLGTSATTPGTAENVEAAILKAVKEARRVGGRVPWWLKALVASLATIGLCISDGGHQLYSCPSVGRLRAGGEQEGLCMSPPRTPPDLTEQDEMAAGVPMPHAGDLSEVEKIVWGGAADCTQYREGQVGTAWCPPEPPPPGPAPSSGPDTGDPPTVREPACFATCGDEQAPGPAVGAVRAFTLARQGSE